MQLDVLGSSGTAPSPGNPASGYLVTTGSTIIWMDAGPGTYMALLDLIDPMSIDAVLLSHTHPDHCTDLFALFHEVAYVRKDPRPIPVVAPFGSAERVVAFAGGGTDSAILATLPFSELRPGQSISVGDVVVTVQGAHHSVPALSYRLEAGGASLGYTGDTGASDDVAAHLVGVDLLMAEASMQSDSPPYPFHMTAREAGELANAAGTGHLVLTHIPSIFDRELSRNEAAEAFRGTLSLALPGEKYTVGSNK